MRIISKFHDYYDSIQSLGQDRSLIYNRQEKEILFDNYPFPIFYYNKYNYRNCCFYIEQKIIGFCGKIYPLLKLEFKGIRNFCYTLEDIDNFIDNNFKEKDIEKYYQRKIVTKSWWPDFQRFRFEEFFNKCLKEKNKYYELFMKEKSPIFVAQTKRELDSYRKKGGYLEFNTCLKRYEFFRIFNTYQAFQEISMFMGNFAAPFKPIPIIKDEIMSEIKGFNKESFRKPSSKIKK